MSRLGTVIRLADRAGRVRAGDGDGDGDVDVVVELRSVSVRFGGRAAVDDVSLTVQRGEWVGIIGANGAGKTTLLRAMAGLTEHQGEVRVDGQATGALGRRARARSIAYVPQSPELPADMSVFDYVLLGRTPHIGYLSVESHSDVAHCGQVLERLGLAPLATRPLTTLSGGERQRAVLARALAQEAPVLLMDEPTSALDVGHRVDALEIVDGLRRDWGLTVVSVLHDLTLAGQFADRLLLLHGGRAAALGPPGDVLVEDVLEASFECRVRIIRTEDGELVVAPRRTGSPGGGPGATGPIGSIGSIGETVGQQTGPSVWRRDGRG